MFEIFFRIWYFIAILPILIAIEGYSMFKKFMSQGNRWAKMPYFLLIFFVILLVLLLIAGYR